MTNQLAEKYVQFINKIGSGKDSQGEGASLLFTEDCSKNFNGFLVAKNRDTFVKDLLSVYKNYGSWKLILLDTILATEQKSIVLHLNIESETLGKNTAIVILRYNNEGLIKELIEVFSAVHSKNIV